VSLGGGKMKKVGLRGVQRRETGFSGDCWGMPNGALALTFHTQIGSERDNHSTKRTLITVRKIASKQIGDFFQGGLPGSDRKKKHKGLWKLPKENTERA